jgi:hypothetical protein
LINEGGSFQKLEMSGLDSTSGWWNTLELGDFNNDGYPDIVAGNHGLNSRFAASREKPITLFINDFDRNGQIEQILSQFNGEESYPLALRHDLIKQMPVLKKKYLKYESYKGQKIDNIFPPELVESSIKLRAEELTTAVYLSNKGKSFTRVEMPIEAQFSTTQAMEVLDVDGDGNQDIILGGNFYGAKPEVGRYDAQYGLLLKGRGDGTFVSISSVYSGLELIGETRDCITVKTKNGVELISAGNNEPLQRFTIN